MAEQHGKALVPQIRFAGFTDPWEQRKLSELVEIERGGSPRPIERYITDDPCGLNWVKIGDAPELGRYITQTTEKIKPEGLAKTRQVYPGDLVLSNSMSFGRPYIMAIKGCIHDGWLLIRDAQKHFDPIFLCHMLGAPQMLNQYRMFAAGSTVNNLNKELVGKAIVSLPSKDEQREIGIVLDRLDSLITLHQRKYDKLCVLKKSMLDKMFPKGGSLYPEIRFAGFTDPWEQRKLGELTESYSGGTPAAGESEFYGGSIPFIRSAEIAAESTELFLTEKGYESSSARMVKPGDVLYALYGATSGEVAVSRQKGAINQAILAILPRDDCDARYITAWLRKQKGYIVTTYLQGGQGNLSGVIVKNLEVFIPSLPEQQKIGFMLSHLDSLITLHQRKLELLRNIKKSMLDKMFV
ncbi:restriction endonuclease subunit S [Bifidobacterium adolescentis]|nr:restriction endonuclease subunit S [Bifidobacterium adolescentis]MDB0618733.1 restriction endonuclease subunit S [Bifidobacterium adolescentis]